MSTQDLPNKHSKLGTLKSQPRLVVLSALNQAILDASIQEHSKYIKQNIAQIDDIAYTLCHGQEKLPVKSFAVVSDPETIEFSPPLVCEEVPKLVMIFSGQGAQWVGMAKELIEKYSSFDSDIRSLGTMILEMEDPPSWNLKEELLKPAETSNVEKPEYIQPLLAAIQIALVNLLAALGVVPDAVIGFSSGEIAAAYASRAITAKEAMIAAYYRGQVVKQLDDSKGGMAAVGLDNDQVLPFLKPGIMVGCQPCPRVVVLSGDKNVLDVVCEDIKKANSGVYYRKLSSSIAYHSHHMLEIGQRYETLLAPHIHSKSPAIPFYSSVSGELVSQPSSLNASYWRENLEKPVNFTAAMMRMSEDQRQNRLFIEVGVRGNMRLPIRDFINARDQTQDAYFPAMSKDRNCEEQFLELVGELFVRNFPIGFDALLESESIEG